MLGLAFFLGIGVDGSQSEDDAKPATARARPATTVAATMAAIAEPEPTPVVTRTVEVEVTETVNAEPSSDSGINDSSDDGSSRNGRSYVQSLGTENDNEKTRRFVSTRALSLGFRNSFLLHERRFAGMEGPRSMRRRSRSRLRHVEVIRRPAPE
ncbi:hypothetical protein [Streptomyces sp. MA15]|uniref:hypothetical protein n=1 Tax=Streptomyces sp. MA15 TaxID=3055061 RepID=UPI0025B1C9E2|nr:hypothetical protein [Streptomyces sp. MA15]MDN3271274.1 hypothetical protein [Streptomyces sp. MA15]